MECSTKQNPDRGIETSPVLMRAALPSIVRQNRIPTEGLKRSRSCSRHPVCVVRQNRIPTEGLKPLIRKRLTSRKSGSTKQNPDRGIETFSSAIYSWRGSRSTKQNPDRGIETITSRSDESVLPGSTKQNPDRGIETSLQIQHQRYLAPRSTKQNPDRGIETRHNRNPLGLDRLFDKTESRPRD